jgi:hypothetical protein
MEKLVLRLDNVSLLIVYKNNLLIDSDIL